MLIILQLLPLLAAFLVINPFNWPQEIHWNFNGLPATSVAPSTQTSSARILLPTLTSTFSDDIDENNTVSSTSSEEIPIVTEAGAITEQFGTPTITHTVTETVTSTPTVCVTGDARASEVTIHHELNINVLAWMAAIVFLYGLLVATHFFVIHTLVPAVRQYGDDAWKGIQGQERMDGRGVHALGGDYEIVDRQGKGGLCVVLR